MTAKEEEHHQQQTSSASQKSKCDELEKQLANLLEQMRLEARSMTELDDREELWERTLQYQRNWDDIVGVHTTPQQQELNNQHQQERNILFEGAVRGSSSIENTGRDRANVRAAIQQEEQNRMVLERALQSINETETVGTQIQEELGRNRETIQSAHERVQNVGKMTQQAQVLLNKMVPWWKR